MRIEKKTEFLHVKVIAGTHVVLLAFKPSPSIHDKLRGFSIQRGVAGKQPVWLKGIKFFEQTVQDPIKGAEYSSLEQPFQTFFWSDYAANPGTTYTYNIVPRFGVPGALTDGEAVDVVVTTEKEDDGAHGVWFNRGVVASHKFAKTFQNQPLTDAMANNVSDAGTLESEEARWLSRGLAEACLGFINGCKPGEGLRVSAYEFTWLPVLKALGRAKARGVDVKIIYHANDTNEKAIEDSSLPQDILTQRTRPPIPHNKFIVKLENDEPTRVWTGSTNFTSTGFMGQTNVGHLVTDDKIARIYLKYWTELKDNPAGKAAREHAIALTPNPPTTIPNGAIVPFFSPRIADNMLDWYGQRISDACAFVMMTLPFNVARQILAALDTSDRALRLVILENEPDRFIKEAEKRNKGRLAFSNGAILGKSFVHIKTGGAQVAPISQGQLDDWFVAEELGCRLITA